MVSVCHTGNRLDKTSAAILMITLLNQMILACVIILLIVTFGDHGEGFEPRTSDERRR